MDQHSAPELSRDNLGPALLIVSWVFASISLVVILMRTYVRVHILQRFNIDDWLIYLTFVSKTVVIVFAAHSFSFWRLVIACSVLCLYDQALDSISDCFSQTKYRTRSNTFTYANFSQSCRRALAGYLTPSFFYS